MPTTPISTPPSTPPGTPNKAYARIPSSPPKLRQNPDKEALHAACLKEQEIEHQKRIDDYVEGLSEAQKTNLKAEFNNNYLPIAEARFAGEIFHSRSPWKVRWNAFIDQKIDERDNT